MKTPFVLLTLFGVLIFAGCSDVQFPNGTELFLPGSNGSLTDAKVILSVRDYVQGLPGSWHRAADTMPAATLTVQIRARGVVVGYLYLGKTWIAVENVPRTRGALFTNPSMKPLTSEQQETLIQMLTP